MTDLLSETRPKARKRYWCGWCHSTIEPGQTYHRQAIANDGKAYTWRECHACDADNITARVGEWTDYEGSGAEDAYEWAAETVIHGTPDDQRAAKNYLERANS